MDFYKAYEDINKALEKEPNYVKAYARKGNIEFVQKEYHKAIDSFKKVRIISSECLTLWYVLASW